VFDAAHECGHLGMHIGLEAGTPELEQQADRFASAFLMPRVGFLREFPRTRHFDWEQLVRLKARWRVSLGAMIRRAYDLQLIDAAQYQRGFRYLRWKGWDKGEPGEGDAEEPTMIATAIEKLKPINITAHDIAKELHLSPAVFERVTGIPAETPPPIERPLADVIPIDFGRKRLP
jgi:Zn-dependent peptidase ImmA (M78 family)